MEESLFEGTLVLEKLAEIGKVDDFMEAVDSDNVSRARQLMKQAQIDPETIATVLEKIENGED